MGVAVTLRRFHAVVLAAGSGSRFEGPGHKALAPIRGDAGTLSLLLDQLAANEGCSGTTVVTGGQAAAVTEFAQRWHPTVLFAHNEDFAAGGPLLSLRAGVAGLPPQDVWVFHADTVYAPEFLAVLTEAPLDPQDHAAICVAPVTPPGEAPASHSHVPVGIEQGRVAGIGPASCTEYEMAPAVWWSRRTWPRLLTSEFQDAHYQRDALAQLVAENPGCVAAREVPRGSFFDVDTHVDWVRARLLLGR